MIEFLKWFWLGLFLPLRHWADKHASVHADELREMMKDDTNNPDYYRSVLLSKKYRHHVEQLNKWNGVSRFLCRISGGSIGV